MAAQLKRGLCSEGQEVGLAAQEAAAPIPQLCLLIEGPGSPSARTAAGPGERTPEGPQVSPREGCPSGAGHSGQPRLCMGSSFHMIRAPTLGRQIKQRAQLALGKSVFGEPLPAHGFSGLGWVWVCRDVNATEQLLLQW